MTTLIIQLSDNISVVSIKKQLSSIKGIETVTVQTDDLPQQRADFYADIDEAKAQARRGEFAAILNTDEDISNYLGLR